MSLEISFEHGTRRLRLRLRPLLVAPSDEGLFARGSVIRRVYSDASVGLGAGRALLLQIAHPSVAAGVHEHSDYEHRPLDRLFATLYAANTVVFGSRAQADEVGAAVSRVHQRVTGPGYRALDPQLLCWVNATLADTAADLYQRLVRPLSRAELDDFIADSRQVGNVFGCPASAQPATWSEFRDYWDETIASLTITDTARKVASSLLRGVGLPMRPLWHPALLMTRAVTAALLPGRLRDGFGLPWNVPERALAAMVLGGAGMVFARMPDRWRQVGGEFLRVPEQIGPRPRVA